MIMKNEERLISWNKESNLIEVKISFLFFVNAQTNLLIGVSHACCSNLGTICCTKFKSDCLDDWIKDFPIWLEDVYL